jgi:integrase
VKHKKTYRTVPLTLLLRQVLDDWLQNRGNGDELFCKTDGKPITPREAHNYFQRALRVSKWSELKEWQLFRHSYISALASKSVDQKIIDDIVGHSTEEQCRRYRHLIPEVKEQAVARVFG